MYGTAKTQWIPPLLLHPLPNPQPRPRLLPAPPHANPAVLRHHENVNAPSSVHPSQSSPNSSPPSLPHLRPLYSPLPLIAKSRGVQGLPWTHTTSPTLTKRQIQYATSWWTTQRQPQLVQPRALTLKVTTGQWQAVKDTLSRPNGQSLTTSDSLVFQQQVQLWPLMLQPITLWHALYRYNQS
jgi:hypothetical protein